MNGLSCRVESSRTGVRFNIEIHVPPQLHHDVMHSSIACSVWPHLMLIRTNQSTDSPRRFQRSFPWSSCRPKQRSPIRYRPCSWLHIIILRFPHKNIGIPGAHMQRISTSLVGMGIHQLPKIIFIFINYRKHLAVNLRRMLNWNVT